jgi:HSP20 family protein
MKEPTDSPTDLARMFERMQELLAEMANNWNGDAFETSPLTASSVNVDLEDRSDEFVLTAELPGFDKDDIDVRVTDRTLRLEAEHEKESTEESDGEYVRRERRQASVARSIRLPGAVETDDIEATYNNGVLTVQMPKSDPLTQGSEIDIN